MPGADMSRLETFKAMNAVLQRAENVPCREKKRCFCEMQPIGIENFGM